MANKYSTPCEETKATITTANAPVAPEIIPGLPPIKAVINPTIKAAYRPTKGWTPATNEKDTASGTNARATVKPAKISVLNFNIDENFRFENCNSLSDIFWDNSLKIFCIMQLLIYRQKTKNNICLNINDLWIFWINLLNHDLLAHQIHVEKKRKPRTLDQNLTI